MLAMLFSLYTQPSNFQIHCQIVMQTFDREVVRRHIVPKITKRHSVPLTAQKTLRT